MNKTAREIAIYAVTEGLEHEVDEIEQQIIEFSKQKDEEQRKLCAVHYKNEKQNRYAKGSDDLILNAPKPEYNE